MWEHLIVLGVIFWLMICWMAGKYRLSQGLPDKDYEAESRLHKRAAYLAGKNIGKSFHVGTRKRKLGRGKL